MTARGWQVRLGPSARSDLLGIVAHTLDRFGLKQAGVYRAILLKALATLAAGPDVPGSVSRDEIRTGLRSLHVARRGWRGRHLLIYRASGGDAIEVVRILHDAMDLARHIPTEDE